YWRVFGTDWIRSRLSIGTAKRYFRGGDTLEIIGCFARFAKSRLTQPSDILDEGIGWQCAFGIPEDKTICLEWFESCVAGIQERAPTLMPVFLRCLADGMQKLSPRTFSPKLLLDWFKSVSATPTSVLLGFRTI